MYAGHASSPPSEAKLMIRPCPLRRSIGAAACEHKNCDFRFASRMRVPLLFGQFFKFCGEKHSGIVDQNVQPPEFPFDRGE